MGAVIIFLLFVLVLLACTPPPERGLALGSMLVVGIAIWLAVGVHLHRVLGSTIGFVVTLAWEHQNDLLLFFAAAIVFIVPILMVYMAVSDEFNRHRVARALRGRRSLKELGLTLRAEHPWVWVPERQGRGRMTRLAGKKRD